MLEPIEIEEQETATTEKSTDRLSADETPVSSEKIEDVKIDTLKADIENKFVSTVLHEMNQLRKRMSQKEKALSELKNRKSGMEQSAFLLEAEEKEKDIEEITTRIKKIESILDNLKKKIEADISDLDYRINDIKKPGIFELLSENGRYYRMLSSELKTKTTLMDVLTGKKSPDYLKLLRLSRILTIVVLSIMLSLLVSWYIFSKKVQRVPPKTASTLEVRAGKFIIKEKDIIDLLEDIRRANLDKNLSLWESRYSKSYLEMEGKKENQLEQWKRFDFKALKYKINEVKIEPGRARGLITWEMELLSKKKTEAKILSQRLYADFIIEDGRLKISSVRKQED